MSAKFSARIVFQLTCFSFLWKEPFLRGLPWWSAFTVSSFSLFWSFTFYSPVTSSWNWTTGTKVVEIKNLFSSFTISKLTEKGKCFRKDRFLVCVIQGSHTDEESWILGCDAVTIGRCLQTICKNVRTPYSCLVILTFTTENVLNILGILNNALKAILVQKFSRIKKRVYNALAVPIL